ncbi:uncharacterized protein AC631_02197 [Debaryomyces fabryi]|uniref:HPP transmembrane region domain-containing protein n=1 Tax=Debaryomyces fabryi TaxID=58627 RepID=A0A0V1Q0N3_9ASCO|nr:uncharacterized protein AC631_02197 [Debaryomyces fabryi]KSA02055.1 hypothetical protein AC631_02197 [Debaryomyces fabryi]CUM46035.1 unnamed protein product [Debaryomyces fabryi]
MVFQFSLDKITTKYLPGNQVEKLPKAFRRFLGCHSPPPKADYWVWLEVFISTFSGIALLEGVFKSHKTVFFPHNAPMIIASYGATSILSFNTHDSPVAQPRNILFGHFVSALTGECITKLFSLSSRGRSNYWAGGALSVSTASVLMSLFNCVHPPAGASALLPSTNEEVRSMGWWYLPAHLVSSVLIISVALITGNIIRRYPEHWWYAGPAASSKNDDIHEKLEEESTHTLNEDIQYIQGSREFEIRGNQIFVPAQCTLSKKEVEYLGSLQSILKDLPFDNEV